MHSYFLGVLRHRIGASLLGEDKSEDWMPSLCRLFAALGPCRSFSHGLLCHFQSVSYRLGYSLSLLILSKKTTYSALQLCRQWELRERGWHWIDIILRNISHLRDNNPWRLQSFILEISIDWVRITHILSTAQRYQSKLSPHPHHQCHFPRGWEWLIFIGSASRILTSQSSQFSVEGAHSSPLNCIS